MLGLFDRIVDKNLLVRRVNISANRVVSENSANTSTPMDDILTIDGDIFSSVETM